MRALISVSDKTGIVDFVRGLVDLGWEIISTGGTSKALKESGISVKDVSDITGFPEIMDGRVKTLHPAVHGGLLALRDNSEHMAKIKELGIEPIDLVCVNLYPFEATIAKPEVELHDVIENIDIGGPSMVRSAAKNYRDVIIVVDPGFYPAILDNLRSQGSLPLELKEDLAVQAYSHTARYDAIISNYLAKKIGSNKESFMNTKTLPLDKAQDLRYGENPHQKAIFYKVPGEYGLGNIKQLHGKELSFNNFIDLDAAWSIAKEFTKPAVTIIKHTNPCGTALGNNLLDAYNKALSCDPKSAFGSIIGLNKIVDSEVAQEMSKLFVEAVIAPGYTDEALLILQEKKNIRVIVLDDYFNHDQQNDVKRVTGGLLVQVKDTKEVPFDEMKCVTHLHPEQHMVADMLFAWKIVKHIRSNAILLVKDGKTVGVGAGQMSRVDAVELALKKAGDEATGAVLASDAFFPFRDSVDTVNKAGIKAIIQPGGSLRDQESIDACNEYGIPMLFTGVRHFKH
ncbi:MAG: bifunctional phosphoribosylaminoimidazolecarboxamide formyltransferase/IMP cyclohydrolase [Candidatus Margulisbacteria bacterium GWF2_38_17]|nr:MAG: bifunctional phosphoribosylaminoimidazolecarboxamide formyltransferase/IMP cyclohydrolase [Candidatus Margulisbacteria bacterium GWD2_39_127]OGI01059.1 MAG: bifunctional phosphoribosylaminoimidazolecarboxamide formyltransferase/IMP cyclohydrolase [Candidatus Margulisbacteria bacterium GWF2_38_17]OGI09588.1 MAG: bifunctional phosphoribosylaminoimidazolecarboxamide formyltransferase/IMP cyclohydrolase [Candidatus Margulisbacteria bacterium GWE2_39_32]